MSPFYKNLLPTLCLTLVAATAGAVTPPKPAAAPAKPASVATPAGAASWW